MIGNTVFASLELPVFTALLSLFVRRLCILVLTVGIVLVNFPHVSYQVSNNLNLYSKKRKENGSPARHVGMHWE
jgi:hypothetical protein